MYLNIFSFQVLGFQVLLTLSWQISYNEHRLQIAS